LSLFALPARDAEARLPQTLWAVVNSDGTLVSKSQGVVSADKLDDRGGRASGDYGVLFSRDVSLCAKTATISSSGASIPASGEIVLTHVGGFGREVQVLTQNSSGAALDQPFSLVVNC